MFYECTLKEPLTYPRKNPSRGKNESLFMVGYTVYNLGGHLDTPHFCKLLKYERI